jgi:hypothetical protein
MISRGIQMVMKALGVMIAFHFIRFWTWMSAMDNEIAGSGAEMI